MTVYQPSDGIDTYLSGETNRGSDPLLQMPPTGRVLIKFDISDISSSAICSVETCRPLEQQRLPGQAKRILLALRG